MRILNGLLVIGLGSLVYFAAGFFGDLAPYIRGLSCVGVGFWSMYDVLYRVG